MERRQIREGAGCVQRLVIFAKILLASALSTMGNLCMVLIRGVGLIWHGLQCNHFACSAGSRLGCAGHGGARVEAGTPVGKVSQ